MHLCLVLVVLLFSAITAHAQNYQDHLLGGAQIHEFPLQYSAAEQQDCLSHITVGPDFEGKSHAACDRILHTVETQRLRAFDVGKRLVSVPTEIEIPAPGGRCTAKAYNYEETSPVHEIRFQLAVDCPAPGNRALLKAAMTHFFANYREKNLTILTTEPQEGTTLAKIAHGRFTLDANQCLSTLQRVSGNYTRFVCQIQSSAELAEFARFKGMVLSPEIRTPSLLSQGTENTGYNDIKASLKPRPDQNGYLIEVSYGDFNNRYPVVTPEIRQEFTRAIAALESLTARIPLADSVTTIFPTTPLQHFRRDVRTNLDRCQAGYQMWWEWKGCVFTYPVVAQDVEFQSLTLDSIPVVRGTIGGNVRSENGGSQIHCGITRSSDHDRETRMDNDTVRSLIMNFVREVPILSYTFLR